MKKKGTAFFITGESPLVEELSGQCGSAGHVSGAGSRVVPRNSGAIRKAQCAFELTNTDLPQKKKNLQMLDRYLRAEAVIVSSSVTVTATEQASWIKHPGRLIGMSALPTFLAGNLYELAPTIWTSTGTIGEAQKHLGAIGKEFSIVQDRIGLVLPRIVCMIINEALFAVMENISTPENIDTAMKLGTNYPMGPIEWGNRIGFRQVLHTLEALHRDLGEDRYRICPLLRQLATGRPWWKT